MATLLRCSLRLSRVLAGPTRLPRVSLHSTGFTAEYRSIYSLERLYPEREGVGTEQAQMLVGMVKQWQKVAEARFVKGLVHNKFHISLDSVPYWEPVEFQQFRRGSKKRACILSDTVLLCNNCEEEARTPCKKRVPVGPSSDFEIPTDRLRISYSRSSGPGGQNVNKVNTKAEIRFHLASADWISEDVRLKIAEKHKNKINKSGELILTSEVSRYQMRNLADCLQTLRDMVTESSTKPKVANKEEAEVRRMRVLAMNRERLQQKRIQSTVKQSRRVDVD